MVTCLGIVAALPGEVEIFTKKPIAAGTVTRLSDRVLLILSGVGAKQASLGGRLLLDNGANALLSWGVAAALDYRLASGSLILPRQVIAADQTVFQVDPDWHEGLYHRLSSRFATYLEPLMESQTILASRVQKHVLFERTGAVAVDMESAALGRLAYQTEVPFLAIRAIADTADMTIPRSVSGAIDPAGRIRLFSLLAQLILHPGEWYALWRLFRSFRAAQTTLTEVARYAGNDLLFSTSSGRRFF